MDTKTILKKYLPAIITLAIIALGVFGFWFAGYLSEKSFDRQIDNLQTNSRTEVTEAANHQKAAANSEVERRTEDGVREKVIVPKLDVARRRSQSSKVELEKAKNKLKENEKNIHDLNASRAANCAELRRQFPDTRFEYCHD
jgi:hypothetical protein